MTDRIARRIASATVHEMGGTVKGLLSPTRGRPADAWRRAVAMYVYCTACADGNLSATGRVFDRDRTVVRHAMSRVRSRLYGTGETDMVLGEVIDSIVMCAILRATPPGAVNGRSSR